MSIPIENPTRGVAGLLLVADEAATPVAAVLYQLTCHLVGNRLVVSDEQRPIPWAGCPWDEAKQTWREEPEAAFFKPNTDVLVSGHAWAGHARATEGVAEVAVGPIRHTARLVGDRVWEKRWLGVRPSVPAPFERIPLRWERTFGGRDTSHADPAKHTMDGRNPVGCGFRAVKSPFVEGIILPNLEDPDAPVEAWGRPVPPVGFGPVGVGWLPRAPLAGSGELGAGGLPSGYDRRFANAAPTALQTKTGWLLGNEAIRLVHIGSAAIIETALPGIPPPEVHFHCRRGPHVRAVAPLDTVVIDADAGIVTLRWRAHVVLSHGYADLLDVAVENPAPALAPIPVTI